MLAGCLLLSPQPAIGQDQPNIVLVFMDNFGWGEPGFNGGGVTRGAATPRLDRLAEEGLRLTNFNVEVQCTPSRSALMTGRYAIRSGNATVPLGEGVYGLVQWTDQGFDEWYGIPNTTDESAWTSLQGFAESGIPDSYVMEGTKGSPPEQVRVYDLEYRPLIDRDLTDRAIDFMTRQADAGNPFFVYLPYTATHFPTRPHPDFAGRSGNGPWADLLMQIDSYAGELLDAVERLGVASNTIFVFTADNGPEAGPSGSTNVTVETAVHGSAGPWRGTLFTGFEGALRVPFVMRWPERLEAGRASDEIVHAMDLFPTFAALAGGTVPEDRPIDGIDVSPFLLGETERSGREGFVVYMGNDVFGVKWRNWKVHFTEQDDWSAIMDTYTMPRIYNLLADPQERDNVIFPNTWVLRVALPQLEEHVASLSSGRTHRFPPAPLIPTSRPTDWGTRHARPRQPLGWRDLNPSCVADPFELT
jgi:arylsulfatase